MFELSLTKRPPRLNKKIHVYSSEGEGRIRPNERPQARKASRPYVANPVYSSEGERRIGPNQKPQARIASRLYVANRVYSSEEKSRIRLKKKPRARKASRRYVASPESNQLKFKCYAIRIALLSEYIRNNLFMYVPKQDVSKAFALHGWGYTLRGPIENLDTIMDEDVVAKYKEVPTLKRAICFSLICKTWFRVWEEGIQPLWDSKVWLRQSSSMNEDCEQLQQLYHEDCIDVGA